MKLGLFVSVFDDYSDPELVKKYALKAERHGWDGVFLPDHLHYANTLKGALDPLMMLSAIAEITQSVKLGTWIVPLPRRQPWQVARDVATLDQLSEGRALLGVGMGSPPEDYTDYGKAYEPKQLAGKLDESLQIINGLWESDNFTFKGKHYSIDNVNLYPKPVQQPRVPILVGGRWPSKKPVQRGARWDGIMPVGSAFPKPLTEEEIADLSSYYREQGGTGDIVISEAPFGEDLRQKLSFLDDHGVTWLMYPAFPDIGPKVGPDEELSWMEEVVAIRNEYIDVA